MKKILYTLSICFAVIMASCDDDSSQDTSKITYYVNFEIQGDEFVTIPLGTAYVEEGVIATEGDNDISESVVITGSVDATTVGQYDITYSAVNADGYASSTTRTVLVYDGTPSTVNIEGNYTSETLLDAGSTQSTQYTGGAVTITKMKDGFFRVSCLLGAWYKVRYPTMQMETPGYIFLGNDNKITSFGGVQPYWKDRVEDAGGSYYDPATGNVHINSAYVGYTFVCDMSNND